MDTPGIEHASCKGLNFKLQSMSFVVSLCRLGFADDFVPCKCGDFSVSYE